MAEWQRVANTTIHKYIRKETVNILRERALLAMLENRGRISYGHSGDMMDWKVRYKRAQMRTFQEMDTLTFARVNRWKTAQLEWRGYTITDMVHRVEKEKNKGSEAIINFYSQMTKNLLDDIREHFSDEFWIDGNASGNSGKIHGVESFMSHTGTGATHGFIVPPNDTYAGLSCTLGNYGGSWSTVSSNVNWPAGRGDSEYDFWSPVIVDITDTAWNASTKTWPNTCYEAIRFAISHGARAKSPKGMMDMILLETDSYRQLKNNIDSKEQLNVYRGEKSGLVALGFRDTINIDGVDVTKEYGMPALDGSSKVIRGYGFNLNDCELLCLTRELFEPDLPDFDITSQSERFAIIMLGNMRFNPRGFCAFKDVT